MILFLDVISPVPKFVITDNNKVIESLPILDRNFTKISDIIHDKFLIFQKKYNLLDHLDYLIVCTGPGSYTSLRVGISFMFGISFSTNIPIYGISCADLLSKSLSVKDFYSTFMIICSANNQNFICLPDKLKKYQYKIMKINDNNIFNNIDIKTYSKCISNFYIPDFLNKKICTNIKKIENINFENQLHDILLNFSNKDNVLQPIYISENKLFD